LCYIKGLSAIDLESYNRKLTVSDNGSLTDPYSIPATEWICDIKKLSYITWRDVTTYLIDTPSEYTKENTKAYRSLEAYDMFQDKHCFFLRMQIQFLLLLH